MTARYLLPLRWPLVLGAIFALLAVVAGAFGAHGLRAMVSERGLEVFQTGATYQMYHGLALIVSALLAGFGLSRRLLALAAGLFALGIILFSGSLYLLVLTDTPALGAITPLGGLCFIAGWALLLAAGLGSTARKEESK